MLPEPEVVREVTRACCILHNMMRIRYPGLQNAALDLEDEDHKMIPGAWREDAHLENLQMIHGPNIDTLNAKKQRVVLSEYYNSPAGSVPWQDRMIYH